MNQSNSSIPQIKDESSKLKRNVNGQAQADLIESHSRLVELRLKIERIVKRIKKI